jgi:demethylmenaquinone methyltransferase/2-methoxy-6-polyprenyl-1,4-benzoquinol methylase
VACGTGDILLRARQRAQLAVGLDVTVKMLVHAAAKTAPPPHLVAGDMQELPFPSSSFTVVTAGYGLRNVPRIEQAIEEIARVLAPRGRLLSLDFNRPEHPSCGRRICLSDRRRIRPRIRSASRSQYLPIHP